MFIPGNSFTQEANGINDPTGPKQFLNDLVAFSSLIYFV